AIVKVRCRYGNVPKARDTEHASVAFAPRDREAAEIGSPRAPPLRKRIGKDPEPLKQIAAHVGALVAGTAAIRLEQLEAAGLLRRDRCVLAAKVAVEPGVGSRQRTLKGSEGVEGAGAVGRATIGSREAASVIGIGIQFREQLLPVRVHQGVIEEHGLVLLLQRAEVAAPIEPEVERNVEDRR